MDASGDARGDGNKCTTRCGACGKTWLNLSGMAVVLRAAQAEAADVRAQLNAALAALGAPQK